MSALTEAPSLFDLAGGDAVTAAGQRNERTLDDVVAGKWGRLRTHQVVACPLCLGEMKPEYGAHALPIGGSCATCGSTLG